MEKTRKSTGYKEEKTLVKEEQRKNSRIHYDTVNSPVHFPGKTRKHPVH